MLILQLVQFIWLVQNCICTEQIKQYFVHRKYWIKNVQYHIAGMWKIKISISSSVLIERVRTRLVECRLFRNKWKWIYQNTFEKDMWRVIKNQKLASQSQRRNYSSNPKKDMDPERTSMKCIIFININS